MLIITSDVCKNSCVVRVWASCAGIESISNPMSVNCESIRNTMKTCIQIGRQFKLTDPDRAMQEIEKLGILYEVLQSVTNFENQLVSDLDVD